MSKICLQSVVRFIYNTRAANVGNYATTKIRTEKGKQAFQQTGPKVWNKLSDFVRRSQSIESFQKKNNEEIYFT